IRPTTKGGSQNLDHGVTAVPYTKGGSILGGNTGSVLSENQQQVEALYEKLDHAPPAKWLFPRRDGMAPIDIRTAWENARDAAGLVDFRFHDIRHSTASYLAMNGASLVEIAEVLGHRTLQMVRRYAHLSESHVKELVQSVNDKVLPAEL
ncbi:site-specific integrase, partial [Roseibium aquae]